MKLITNVIQRFQSKFDDRISKNVNIERINLLIVAERYLYKCLRYKKFLHSKIINNSECNVLMYLSEKHFQHLLNIACVCDYDGCL